MVNTNTITTDKTTNKSTSVVDNVLDSIVNEIISGELSPGDKLPTENELSLKYGAGRNSVREAVKKLQAYGILYIKRADGTYVSDSYNQKMLDPLLYSIILQKNSLGSFVELRTVIDIGILNLIIQRKDITDFLPGLYRTFGELSAEMHSEHPDAARVMELDNKFHSAISDAAENPMITTFAEYISRLSQPSRYATTERIIRSGNIEHFLELHRQMISVIEAKRTENIVKVVKDHYVYWEE
ncbi:MAG: GntR family transcriptional regulator [Eubacteriales bacterium]|nr:GntR family transcriptional regulator [Eubacteriales bacterium]